MNQNTLNGMQRQLKQLFRGLEAADDATASKRLTETCAALLRLVKNLKVDFTALSEDDLEDMVASYTGISQAVSSFAGQLRDHDAAEAERCARAGGADALARALEEGKNLRAEAVQLAEDLKRQIADNEDLQEDLGRKKGDYADACTKYRRLRDELDAFYPHKLNQQLMDNAELEQELTLRTDQLRQAQEQHGALTRRLDEDSARLSQLEQALEALPEDVRRLGETCVEKERYLDRLRNARQEFGPERQKELQEEIDTLQGEVQELEDAIRTLKNTLNNLKETHTVLDRDRQHLETDLLERISTCMTELNNISLEHRHTLDEVSRQADSLAENLSKCAELRQRYAAWWEADRTPLEMIQGILDRGDPLDEELSGSLDPAKSRRLSDLNSSVKTALEEMDSILALCLQAMRQDGKAVSDKVSRIQRS